MGIADASNHIISANQTCQSIQLLLEIPAIRKAAISRTRNSSSNTDSCGNGPIGTLPT